METKQLFEEFAAEVYRHTAVTVDETKRSLLSSRIRRRVRALGLERPEDYLKLLKSLDSAAEEIAEFVDVVTTHKTSFFRTASVWNWLLKSLHEDEDAWQSFDVWSCASSTGQEPYSLAMAGATIASKRPRLRWSVHATDVAQPTLELAKAGVYTKDQIDAAAGARPDVQVARFFEAHGDGERKARKDLRQKMTFKPHSLIDPMAKRFDVAFLRNVLIYFNEEDKHKVVENVLRTLRPGGLLVIGESESLLQRDDGLEYVSPCIYRTPK